MSKTLGTCDDCRYAKWRHTKAGRLHPDKSGLCGYLNEHPLDLRIPGAFYFFNQPKPYGGQIERGKTIEVGCIFKDGSKERPPT